VTKKYLRFISPAIGSQPSTPAAVRKRKFPRFQNSEPTEQTDPDPCVQHRKINCTVRRICWGATSHGNLRNKGFLSLCRAPRACNVAGRTRFGQHNILCLPTLAFSGNPIDFKSQRFLMRVCECEMQHGTLAQAGTAPAAIEPAMEIHCPNGENSRQAAREPQSKWLVPAREHGARPRLLFTPIVCVADLPGVTLEQLATLSAAFSRLAPKTHGHSGAAAPGVETAPPGNASAAKWFAVGWPFFILSARAPQKPWPAMRLWQWAGRPAHLSALAIAVNVQKSTALHRCSQIASARPLTSSSLATACPQRAKSAPCAGGCGSDGHASTTAGILVVACPPRWLSLPAERTAK